MPQLLLGAGAALGGAGLGLLVALIEPVARLARLNFVGTVQLVVAVALLLVGGVLAVIGSRMVSNAQRLPNALTRADAIQRRVDAENTINAHSIVLVEKREHLTVAEQWNDAPRAEQRRNEIAILEREVLQAEDFLATTDLPELRKR